MYQHGTNLNTCGWPAIGDPRYCRGTQLDTPAECDEQSSQLSEYPLDSPEAGILASKEDVHKRIQG